MIIIRWRLDDHYRMARAGNGQCLYRRQTSFQRRLYSITKTINSRLKEEKARAESYREGWKLVFDRAETAEADNIKIREELNEETKKKHLLMADNERLVVECKDIQQFKQRNKTL